MATLQEKKLSYKERKRLPSSKFVFPKSRKYPIHDRAHARNALARVSQFGSESEKSKVRSAVRKKYPGIEVEGKAKVVKLPQKKEKKLAASRYSVFDAIIAENTSRFDSIVSGGASIFDAVIEQSQTSIFDDIVESSDINESSEDKAVKAMLLSEQLVKIRDSLSE